MKEYFEDISWPLVITFLGAAFGALLSSVEQNKESKENSRLNKELRQKSDEIANYVKDQLKESREVGRLQNLLIEEQKQLENRAIDQTQKTEDVVNLSRKLNDTQAKLNEAQEKTISFTSESLKYLTGGDSYCFVSMTGLDEGKDEVRVKLFHHGKYPLSALRVTITRTSAISRQSERTGYYARVLSGVH